MVCWSSVASISTVRRVSVYGVASELGADGLISKPFDLEDFLNVVERLSLR